MESLQFFSFLFSMIFLSIAELSLAADMLSLGQSIRDGETLVSIDQTFELGFFSPGKSSNRYVGIWFKISPQSVVWVANSVSPIADKQGVLSVNKSGNLVLSDQTKTIIWSSNSSRVPENPVAQLLESGNLVLRESIDAGSERYLWQSFDYPSDTLLTGMKLGWNLKTGFERHLTSWRSANDPSPGEYTVRLDISGAPQLVIGSPSKTVFRSGPWNGLQFTGVPFTHNSVFELMVVHTEDELYYAFEPSNNAIVTLTRINQLGIGERLVRNKKSSVWTFLYAGSFDQCDDYAQCAANSYCRPNKIPLCECLKGFVPRSQVELDTPQNRKCVRKSPLESDCRNGEGFLKLGRMKVPDRGWVNQSMDTTECRTECLKNCSCRAYSLLNVSAGGSGCLMWFGDLIDMKECSEQFTWGQDIFIRVPASELVKGSNKKKIIRIVTIISTISAVTFILGIVLCKVYWKKIKNKGKEELETSIGPENRGEDLEVPLFDFATITAATNNFSSANMIGEGGFGPVYKGNLSGGPDIAVKRLAKDSRQGLEEFKTEVVLIGKLQHRNLVGLIGGCIEGDERMLIYEFMPNKSLDYFIFDDERRNLLPWRKRFDIVIGIARGLLYLHQDSKLQIVHRDLKASNILLDGDLNPKISDFGLARIFKDDGKEVNTKRVVGTYGYMSPEYAAEGKFSTKSDGFSFGVLLLEIISGKRNRGFDHPGHHHNLIGHAWLLWNEGRALELMDTCLQDCFIESEVQRCIQVGLLCVQQSPQNRPEMSSVVFMLANDGVVLPQPRQPGFFTESCSSSDTSSNREKSHSKNALSISILEGR